MGCLRAAPAQDPADRQSCCSPKSPSEEPHRAQGPWATWPASHRAIGLAETQLCRAFEEAVGIIPTLPESRSRRATSGPARPRRRLPAKWEVTARPGPTVGPCSSSTCSSQPVLLWGWGLLLCLSPSRAEIRGERRGRWFGHSQSSRVLRGEGGGTAPALPACPSLCCGVSSGAGIAVRLCPYCWPDMGGAQSWCWGCCYSGLFLTLSMLSCPGTRRCRLRGCTPAKRPCPSLQGLNFYPDFRPTFNPPLLANNALAKLGKMSLVPMSGAGFPPGS